MLAMIKSLFSRAGGTSADSLNRSPGSLDTSRGPECGVSRFGVAQTPGLIIDHPTRLRYPAYDLSKNLPAASGRTNVTYLGLYHRAGPTLNAWASALRHNIPPKACSSQAGSGRVAVSLMATILRIQV